MSSNAPLQLTREAASLVFSGALLREAITPARLREAEHLCKGAATFDLAAVTAIDSAGLAFLVTLAKTLPALQIHTSPDGFPDLCSAYRLDARLAFANG